MCRLGRALASLSGLIDKVHLSTELLSLVHLVYTLATTSDHLKVIRHAGRQEEVGAPPRYHSPVDTMLCTASLEHLLHVLVRWPSQDSDVEGWWVGMYNASVWWGRSGANDTLWWGMDICTF